MPWSINLVSGTPIYLSIYLSLLSNSSFNLELKGTILIVECKSLRTKGSA